MQQFIYEMKFIIIVLNVTNGIFTHHDSSSIHGYSSSHICGGSNHCAWPEVTWPEMMSVTCPVRKYVLRMRNRKLRHIRPSGAFWPVVTKSRDRKRPWPEVGSAHARIFPRFFLSSSSSNMATGCDRRSRDPRRKCPWGVLYDVRVL